MQRNIRQSQLRPTQAQTPKSADQYLKDLEALLKRNTGQGLYTGQDVSSNTPMYLPGKVTNPGGIGDSAPSVAQYGSGMTQPAPVQRQAPMEDLWANQPGDNQEPGQMPEMVTIDDFLNAFDESYNAPENQQTFGDPQLEGIMSTPDGGAMLADGTIVYEDGTYRMGDPNAQAIASDQAGGTRYSDGSVRKVAPTGIASVAGDRERIQYDDGTQRYGNYQYGDGQQVDTQGGLQGLISTIFGKMRPVTQAYGNYNPQLEPGSGYNLGTDIRTRDLSGQGRELKLPVGAEVVQVLQDDGTRFGDISGHQGYGNSVLVKLATGEMLRFSHLANTPQVKVGQKLEAGQVFGTPGASGNTTGEHLDLEYYNAQGQISSPAQFSGFHDPQGLRTPLPNQPAPGTLVPQNQPEQPQQQAPQPVQAVQNAFKEAAPKVANTINKINPTGSTGLGITETLQGNPQAAKAELANTISGVGTAFNAPDLNTKALSAEQNTNPFRQLAGNVLDYASTPLKKLGLPDTGLSEAIAGGKTLNTDVNLAPQAGASDGLPMSKQKTPQDYSGVLGQNVQDVVAQAGQGIKSLGQAGVSALSNVFKPTVEKVKRAVGDVSGTANQDSQSGQFSSLMDTASSMSKLPKNDIRDSFFKMGGAEMYKDYMTPNADTVNGGALSLETFTPDFYKDLGNISSVFGGSKDLQPATSKFVGYETAKYPKAQLMSRMGYSDEYDSGSIDAYNREIDNFNNQAQSYNSSIDSYLAGIPRSVEGQKSIFTPRDMTTSKNVFAQPQMSVAPVMSKMPAFSASNSSLARPSTAPMGVSASMLRSPSVSAPSMSSPQQSNKPGSSAPQMSVMPKAAPKPAFTQSNSSLAKPVVNGAFSSVNSSVMPKASSAVMKKAPAPQSKPTSNVFKTVTQAIKNIFRR